MLIEPGAQGMHQDRSRDPIAQIPQIACPDAFELAAIGELPKDGVNAIANLSEHRTLVRCGLRRMSSAIGGLQHDAIFAQTDLDGRDPIGAIPNASPCVSSSTVGAISPSVSLAGERSAWVMPSGQPKRRCKRKP